MGRRVLTATLDVVRWKEPDEAVEVPERVVARVMDIGDFNDAQALAEALEKVRL
jgi:hypothetical protein